MLDDAPRQPGSDPGDRVDQAPRPGAVGRADRPNVRRGRQGRRRPGPRTAPSHEGQDDGGSSWGAMLVIVGAVVVLLIGTTLLRRASTLDSGTSCVIRGLLALGWAVGGGTIAAGVAAAIFAASRQGTIAYLTLVVALMVAEGVTYGLGLEASGCGSWADVSGGITTAGLGLVPMAVAIGLGWAIGRLGRTDQP